MKYVLCLLLPILLLFSCKTDYANLPTYSGKRQLQAVIEVPAGSSHRIVYNEQTKEFENDKEAGLDRVVDFLPFPANVGFIPSTEVSSNGKGLEVAVLTGRQEPGTVMEIDPIAVLQLETDGELEHIIVAVPARPSERTISATDFASFSKKYPAAKEILQKWFSNADPNAHKNFVGWRDEKFADQEVQRWMKL